MGEKTSDGWGVIPMNEPVNGDFSTIKWMALLPDGKETGKDGVGWGSYGGYVPNAVLAGECNKTVGPSTGQKLWPEAGVKRATSELMGNIYRIYITGVCTSGDLMADVADIVKNHKSMANKSDFSFTTTAVVQEIYRIKNSFPGVTIEIYAHSLGALEATLIYNLPNVLNSSDTVYALSPPDLIHSSYMLPTSGEASYIAYSASNDVISNGLNKESNTKRIADGVNLIEVDLGGTLESHDRCKYQEKVPSLGKCIF